MTISQQDIDVRLQLTGCKLGELTNLLANDLKYGRKCAKENQKLILLLNAYTELIECYSVSDIKGYILITFGTLPINTEVQFFANGEAISDLITISTATATEQAIELATAINSYSTSYTAGYIMNRSKNITSLYIYTPCSNPEVTVVRNGGSPRVLDYVNYGKCSPFTNCITQDQLLVILDNISKLTKICF